MEGIRYKQRVWDNEQEIYAFLKEQRTGILAMQMEEFPYAIPINYVWLNNKIYFHGMGSGKKVELLKEGANVCFTVYFEFGTVTDPMPCHADTSYQSVVIFGKAERLTDFEESAEALQILVEKYMPGFYKQKMSGGLIEKYRSSMDGNGVAVYAITPVQLTAKQNKAEEADLFGHHRQ